VDLFDIQQVYNDAWRGDLLSSDIVLVRVLDHDCWIHPAGTSHRRRLRHHVLCANIIGASGVWLVFRLNVEHSHWIRCSAVQRDSAVWNHSFNSGEVRMECESNVFSNTL